MKKTDKSKTVVYPSEDQMKLAKRKRLKKDQFHVQIYLDDGRIYEYNVFGHDKGREHSAAIVTAGYRHNDGVTFEHYGPHRILKVKVTGGIPTHYKDRASGT